MGNRGHRWLVIAWGMVSERWEAPCSAEGTGNLCSRLGRVCGHHPVRASRVLSLVCLCGGQSRCGHRAQHSGRLTVA